MKWPNPFRKRVRDGIFPTTSGEATSGRKYDFPTSHERHIPIPHAWRSRRDGRLIPTTRGEASSGRNYISTTTAKPQVGNWDVPWVTSGEFTVPSPPPKGMDIVSQMSENLNRYFTKAESTYGWSQSNPIFPHSFLLISLEPLQEPKTWPGKTDC